MTVILTAMNRFLNETNGLQMAFLDGNQPQRLCAPLREYIEARGGEVRLGSPMLRFELDPASPGGLSVAGLRMAGRDGQPGELITADVYVSAMPVDPLKLLLPPAWAALPFFAQLDELEGIPVINLHLWFDRKLSTPDHLTFSRSPLLSVYADMSTCCKEYADPHKSMLELVFAPCSPLAGSDVNWIGKADEEIIAATMGELERLFPTEVAADGSKARLLKYAVVKARGVRVGGVAGGACPFHAVVRARSPPPPCHPFPLSAQTPRSVYAATPGRNKFRPSQETPVPNLVLAGDFTSQKARREKGGMEERKIRALGGATELPPLAPPPPFPPPQFLGSMEGAVLSGKLAAEVVACRAAGLPTAGLKPVQQSVVDGLAARRAAAERQPTAAR